MFRQHKWLRIFVFVGALFSYAVAQAAPELIIELGHGAPVESAAWSPDGRTLATGDASGAIRLRDASGVWRSTLDARAGVTALAFSPDGETLAAGGHDGKVRLWSVPQNAASPQPRQVLDFGEGKVSYRSGDKYFPVDARPGDEAVTNIAWSRDGQFIAASGFRGRRSGVLHETRLRVWNAAGESLWTRVLEPADVSSVTGVTLLAFDGAELITAQAPNKLVRWNVQSGEPGQTLELPEEATRGANASQSFSPDGTRVLVRGADALKIYDTQSGQVVTTLEVALAPEDPAMVDRRRQMAEQMLGRPLPAGRPGRPSSGLSRLGGVMHAAWSQDGKGLAAVFGQGAWLVWDAQSGKQLQMVSPRGERLMSLALSPDASTLAAGDLAGEVEAWNVAAGARTFFARGNLNPIPFVDFVRDATAPLIVAGHENGLLALWNTREGKLERTLRTFEPGTPERDLTALAVSPDGKLLATGGYLETYTLTMRNEGVPRGEVRVTDLAGNRVLWKRPDASFGEFRGLQFWPDGENLVVAMGGRPGRVRSGLVEGEGFGALDWVDAQSGTTRETPVNFGAERMSGTEGFAFSPDATKLAVSDPNRLRVWDTKSGKVLLKPSINGLDAPRMVFSPDGRWLATAEASRLAGGRITLWDTTKERGENNHSAEAYLIGHPTAVQDLAFSPDGHTLWSADLNGTLAAWDMTAPLEQENKPLQMWPGDGIAILNLQTTQATAASNVTLTTASADGKVRLWRTTDPANPKLLVTLQLIAPPVPVAGVGKPMPVPPTTFDWIAYTSEGFYNASPGAHTFLFARENGELLPAAAVETNFHRPDLVQKSLHSED